MSGNSTVFVDTSSDNITLILPSAGSVPGRHYFIKKTSELNDLWVYADTKIDDQHIVHMSQDSTGYPFASLISNGTQWYLQNISTDTVFANFIDEELILWLDGNDLDGDGQSEGLSEGNVVSGNQVNYWVDKSIYSDNLSQARAGNQPILRTSAQNSLDSVYCDGTDDFIKITGFNRTSAQHIFIVLTPLSVGNLDTFVGTDNDKGNIRLSGSTSLRTPGSNTDGNDFGNPDGQYRVDGSTGSSFTANTAFMYSITRGSTVNSSPYSDLVFGRASSGLGRNPEFELHEILIYNRVLSDRERDIVEDYLSTKWGTP